MKKLNYLRVILMLLFLSVFTLSLYAQDETKTKEQKSKQEQTTMKNSSGKYLVKFEHTPEQCLSDLEKIKDNNEGMLSQIYWGCNHGDHTGYMMTDANSEQAAVKGIPSGIKTEVVQLDKFNKKQIEDAHKQMSRK